VRVEKRLRRFVVKVGTSSLTDRSGRIAPPAMWAIARGASVLADEHGARFVLVSSGAGAAGRERLGLDLPLTLPDKQAAAAVGQTLLMLDWSRALAPRPVAQLLLSADDVRDRERYVNAKHALEASLRLGAVPVVNENDSVATSELKLGDNDTLSAWVSYLVDADALIILTDVDGLYEADPRRSRAPAGSRWCATSRRWRRWPGGAETRAERAAWPPSSGPRGSPPKRGSRP